MEQNFLQRALIAEAQTHREIPLPHHHPCSELFHGFGSLLSQNHGLFLQKIPLGWTLEHTQVPSCWGVVDVAVMPWTGCGSSTCFISENTLSWWFCKSLGKLCLRPVCFLKWGVFLLCCSPHPLFLFIFCKFLRHRNQKCKITKSTYAGLKIEQKNQIPAKGYKAELQIIVNRDWHEVQPSIPSPAVAVGWGSVSRAGTSDASPLLLPRLQLFSAQGLCARSDFCVDSKHE